MVTQNICNYIIHQLQISYMCQNYKRWFRVDKVIAMKKCFLTHPLARSGATAVDSFITSIHFNWLPVFSILALIILFYYSHCLTTPSQITIYCLSLCQLQINKGYRCFLDATETDAYYISQQCTEHKQLLLYQILLSSLYNRTDTSNVIVRQ